VSEYTKICFQKENFKLILVAKWLFFFFFLKYVPCAVRIVACSVMLHCLTAFLLYTVLLYYSKVKILAEIIWF